MNILIAVEPGETKTSFFTEKAVNKLKELGKIVFYETRGINDKQGLIERIQDIEVLFTGWRSPKVDKEVMQRANKLKIHAHTGGSVANYVSREEYEKGVIVLSGNDIYAKSVAEGCICYMLMSLRQTQQTLLHVKNGNWRMNPLSTKGLRGKKVGLVGYGAISKYLMELLYYFGADVYVYSKHANQDELQQRRAKSIGLEELFATCDIISLHSAQNNENRGLIGKNLIASIKDGALFVNTSRAGIVDNKALLFELQKNRFDAVLDVFEEEPLPTNSPWRDLKNTLIFPHVAGPTVDLRQEVVLELARDIENIENGKQPQNAIHYEYAIRMTN